MHPAYSVILFTTASGAGYGLAGAAWPRGPPARPCVEPLAFALTAIVIALALITRRAPVIDLPSRPSRTRLAGLLAMALVLAVARRCCLRRDLCAGARLRRCVDRPHRGAATRSARSASSQPSMCAVTVFCTAKIYSTLTTIRAWSQPLTVPVYLAFALATGATLLTAIASLFGRFQAFQAILAIVALAPRGPAQIPLLAQPSTALPGRTPSKPPPAWVPSAACANGKCRTRRKTSS